MRGQAAQRSPVPTAAYAGQLAAGAQANVNMQQPSTLAISTCTGQQAVCSWMPQVCIKATLEITLLHEEVCTERGQAAPVNGPLLTQAKCPLLADIAPACSVFPCVPARHGPCCCSQTAASDCFAGPQLSAVADGRHELQPAWQRRPGCQRPLAGRSLVHLLAYRCCARVPCGGEMHAQLCRCIMGHACQESCESLNVIYS